MIITREQLEIIKPYLPTQRKKEKIERIDFLNEILYMVENGANGGLCHQNFVRTKEIGTQFTLV